MKDSINLVWNDYVWWILILYYLSEERLDCLQIKIYTDIFVFAYTYMYADALLFFCL